MELGRAPTADETGPEVGLDTDDVRTGWEWCVQPALRAPSPATRRELGALLPCNVVVCVDGGETHTSAIDPVAMLGIVGNHELDPVAAEIRARIERAVAKVWQV